jgi:hypothetical protein
MADSAMSIWDTPMSALPDRISSMLLTLPSVSIGSQRRPGSAALISRASTCANSR